MKNEWGADVAVSLPRPPRRTSREVDMYGFVFTENGLFHNLSDEEHQRMQVPTYGPALDPEREVVYGDEGT